MRVGETAAADDGPDLAEGTEDPDAEMVMTVGGRGGTERPCRQETAAAEEERELNWTRLERDEPAGTGVGGAMEFRRPKGRRMSYSASWLRPGPSKTTRT